MGLIIYKLILTFSSLVAFSGQVPILSANYETTAIPAGTNSSDDVAIWSNSKKSLILGVSKHKLGGIGLYQLNGTEIKFYEQLNGKKIGPINNIDLRYNFAGKIDIVAASNRSRDGKSFRGISLFQIDGEREMLMEIGDFPLVDANGHVLEPYGLCMYHSKNYNRFFVYSVLKNGYLYEQEIIENDSVLKLVTRRVINFEQNIDKIKDVKLVDFTVKDVLADYLSAKLPKEELSQEILEELGQRYQLEGCVADDDQGLLYVGMEKLGVFKLQIESLEFKPELILSTVKSKNDPKPIFFPPNLPRITDDVEGMSLIGDYLLISIQGLSEYLIFDRFKDKYIGSFRLSYGDKDPVNQTDGLDVLPIRVSAEFPRGVLVVHDHENTDNLGMIQNGNYKILDLGVIIDAFNLKL